MQPQTEAQSGVIEVTTEVYNFWLLGQQLSPLALCRLRLLIFVPALVDNPKSLSGETQSGPFYSLLTPLMLE